MARMETGREASKKKVRAMLSRHHYRPCTNARKNQNKQLLSPQSCEQIKAETTREYVHTRALWAKTKRNTEKQREKTEKVDEAVDP